MVREMQKKLTYCLLFAASLAGVGCGGNVQFKTTPSPTGPSSQISGNWEFQLTSTGGAAVFPKAAGSINEQAGAAGQASPVTAALVGTSAQPTSCFASEVNVPLVGSVQASELGLRSFTIDGQYINLAAAADATGATLTGTYSVDGGCANGASGTLNGQQYQLLSGNYSSAPTGSGAQPAVHLTLTQINQATGDGRFLVSGSAAFSGFSCFTKGALSFPDGYVRGSDVELSLSTDDPAGGRVVLSGQFTSAADMITLNSAQVVGGSCPQSFGPLSLAKAAN